MLSDATELLDRQVAFLVRQQGPEFFLQLPAVIASLGSDPRLEALLEDLHLEMLQLLEGINARRSEVKDALQARRTELVAAFPAVDDSQAPSAVVGDRGSDAYESSLALFDKLSKDTRERWPNVRRIDKAQDPLEQMVRLLDAKLKVIDPTGTDSRATPLRISLGNCRNQLEHVQREFHLSAMTSAAVAALRLRVAAGEVNPVPVVRSEPRTLSDLWTFGISELRGAYGLIRRYAYLQHEGQATPEDQRHASALRAQLCSDLSCFHEEARRRLGLRRSLRGIVDRYGARAMWHDAASLRNLATKNGKAEDLLTADFARYLHDQGLNPLTKPMTGGLQPDLLAPTPRWTFYAEAKQYADGRRRSYLVKGVHQVWDTLGRLRGGPYEVREAFYVVFRRGGPRFVFPAELRSEGAIVYPIVIDIAEASKSGSRQREQPVMISAEELAPRREAGAESTTRRAKRRRAAR